MPMMSKSFDGPAPDDLGERADADAHELAAGPLLGLLLEQVAVADLVERLLQRGVVVARVVLPAGGAVVRELVLADEVLHPELGRVHADHVGRLVDQPLDRVDRLGHAERAAVGDAAGRLVRVGRVDLDERLRHLVAAGDDVEQAGRVLARVGGGVGIAVVGERLDAQAGHRAVVLEAELGVDVVVAGERVGLEVLGPVLDPLHGPAERQRGDDGDHVARVDRHLAAEPAADVVGLDPDRRLGDAGDQADDRAVGVGRLARDVEVEVAVDRVVVGDAATGLDRGHVDARDVDVDRARSGRTPRGRRRSPPGHPTPSARCGCWPCPGRGPAAGRGRRARGP